MLPDMFLNPTYFFLVTVFPIHNPPSKNLLTEISVLYGRIRMADFQSILRFFLIHPGFLKRGSTFENQI
jgi:hypothetical protein